MKKILSLFSLLVLVSFLSVAQKITLCESYDSNTGEPSGIYSSWDINPDGGYVYIVYKQDAAIRAKDMYLYIDKKKESSGEYLAYETIDLVPEKGKNWVMYDYKFTEAGKYKLEVLNDGKVLATTTTEIFVKDDDKKDDTKAADDDGDPYDTYYYENSTVLFGTSVNSQGELQGEATEFKLGRNDEVEIAVYMTNDGPFATKALYVEIYDEDDNSVEEFTIDIEKDWDWVKFMQKFTEPGTYYIDIYNEEDTYVNSAQVTITD